MSANQDFQLIEKVELRFALADTNEKFQSTLNLYLPPLLLKFASNDNKVKIQLNKTIKFLLSKFNATPGLKLPSKELLNQVKSPNLNPNQDPTIVQSYTLLFLSKSIPRLSIDEQIDLFPYILENISTFKPSISARLFNISCKILDNINEIDKSYIIKFSSNKNLLKILQNENDKSFLIEKYYKFMLLHSISTLNNSISQPGLSIQDCSFFFYYAGVTFNSSTLSKYKLIILKFIENIPILNNFLIFLCASADSDSNISSFAWTCLKRIQIDYENKILINTLINLFIGDSIKQPVKIQLQEKILNILCKSKIATTLNSIEKISSIGLNSSNIRLKQSTVSFVRWYTTNNTLNYSNNDTIIKIANQLKLNLSDLSIDKSNPNYLDNRRYQYETLGLLLKKSKNLLDIPYIQFLIDMYNIDDKQLQPTINDSLIGLITNLNSLSEIQKIKLKDLFIEIFEKSTNDISLNDSMNQIRFIGVKYINYLFPFNDTQARIINILAQTKLDKIETIEEAKKGLNPYLFKLNNNLDNLIEFPNFDLMINYILKYKDIINLEVAITFTFRCLIMNITPKNDSIITIDQYWETRVDKSLDVDSKIKDSFISRLKEFHDIDGNIINNFENSSLKLFIDLTFNFVIVSNSLSVLIILTKIITLCSNIVIDSLTDHIPSLLNNQLETLSNESFHYVSQLIGIICTTSNVSNEKILQILNQLIKENSISSIGFIISRLALRNRIDIISDSLFTNVLNLIEKNFNSSTTKLFKMNLDCISQLSMFGCLGPNLKLSSSLDDYKIKFVEKLKPLVEKCNESSIYPWCYLALSYNSLEEERVSELNLFEKALYETHNTKQTDNLFTSGEGFAILCDGWSSNFMKDKNDIPGCSIPSNLNPNRCSIILDNILQYCKTTKPSLRKSACIWLLSIVQYCSDNIIIDRISEIQFAFMRFLSDREEIVQESASRGLSITYEKGDYDIQETLVHNLLKSFTDSNKTSKDLISGYVDENTQLFDSGVLNTGDGESISTYKDVLNLASEVGNPSLVYKFMSLAKNSALWSSRKGIAFGLGAILDKEKLDKLLKENPNLSNRLIPKLFRYKYDPSTSISRTMNNIWNSLILNNKQTIDENFDSILKELLNGMGDREWRIREASTSALQDLLRQCEFDKFEKNLENIWLMAFRAMDDIKSSVRKEGTELTRFLANTMVLKLNNSSSNITVQSSILKKLIPFLLGNNGLLSDSEDVKKFAFDTIMKLVSTHSNSLKPFVSNMVKQLITLMSSVEPQVINYLTLNADKYNLKVEDIDSQRIGIVGSSPMMEAIEKLMDLLDENTIDEFIEELGSAIKQSIGLPSKVAGSKVIVNLILRHFFIIRNSGDKLLKIASGQLKDRNETVAKSYAIACGYCIRISSIKKIESFGKKLTKYYFEKKSDTSSDDKLPKIASVASESVSNFANDKLHSNASIFLPLSFIGKHDLNENIAKNFNKVWSDSTSSSVSSIKLYFPEIISLIKSHIQSQTFSLRKTIALSIIEIIDTLDTKINDLNPSYINELYELLLESLNGRVYDGKEKLLDSLVKLSCKSQKFLFTNDEMYSNVEKRILNEANRKNKTYKNYSILQLGNFLHVYYEDDLLYDKYIELIENMISLKEFDSDDEDEDDHDVDGDAKMKDNSNTKVNSNFGRIELIQKVFINLIYSISNGEKINFKVLNYVLIKINEFLRETNIDYLPNSDSKYKFKQGIISVITELININENNCLNEHEKPIFEEKLFSIWLQSKDIIGTPDNLQSTLVGFTRLTGLLLEKICLHPENKEKCLITLKLLKSENVNSVITVECDKILAQYKYK
ncbi:proteasome component M29 [Pichia californica]|nr:proteasome component M29 [[Candida] californica]